LSSLAVTAIVSALAITNITPSQGPVAGGQIATITGTGFEPDTPTLQNFGADKCVNMTVYDGSNPGALLTLTDPRNDQTYTIGKLADNNCWMLDNLKLGSTTGTMTLTDADTDLHTKTTFTLPQLVTSGSFNYDVPGAYGPVPGDGSGDHNYGYLYNWAAATAGATRGSMPGTGVNNNIAPDSICPSGWHMPTGGAYNNPSNELSQLNAKMAGFTDDQDPAYSSGNAFITLYANWQYAGSFRGVFSGRYLSSFDQQGAGDWMWSSSAYTANADRANYAYILMHSPSFISPGTYDPRSSGYAVRCLAATSTVDANHYDPKPYVTVDGVAVDPGNVELVSDTELRIKMPAHVAGVVDVVITLGGVSQTVQYEYLPSAPNTGAGKATAGSAMAEFWALAVAIMLGVSFAARKLAQKRR
jgi:uncharacterized protein (TIGR02145 family)